MKRSHLSVSLVIPAYNEERVLRQCLEAAVAQQRPFDEIIVVDNNSSDKTAAIARSFPSVTVIQERKQGKVHARTAGFDRAKHEIIARIDADTILPPEWSTQVQQIFTETDTDAVSGLPRYYDLPWPSVSSAIEHFFRRRLAHALRESLFLQGANMALRRSAWLAVRAHLCTDSRDIHEDFDVAIHLQKQGFKVTYEEHLVAGLSARAVDVDFKYFLSYLQFNTRTYAVHHIRHYKRMYPVLVMIVILFWPARLLFRGRNPKTGKFSISWLLSGRAQTAPGDHAIGSLYLS